MMGGTHVESCWNRSLCSNVALVGPLRPDVVRVDIVAFSVRQTFDFNPAMLVWPDVVIAILRALLDTCYLDAFVGILSTTWCSVCYVSRQGLLHPLLLSLLDVKELVGNLLAVVVLVSRALQPLG